jgi:hypothetical protein
MWPAVLSETKKIVKSRQGHCTRLFPTSLSNSLWIKQLLLYPSDQVHSFSVNSTPKSLYMVPRNQQILLLLLPHSRDDLNTLPRRFSSYFIYIIIVPQHAYQKMYKLFLPWSHRHEADKRLEEILLISKGTWYHILSYLTVPDPFCIFKIKPIDFQIHIYAHIREYISDRFGIRKRRKASKFKMTISWAAHFILCPEPSVSYIASRNQMAANQWHGGMHLSSSYVSNNQIKHSTKHLTKNIDLFDWKEEYCAWESDLSQACMSSHQEHDYYYKRSLLRTACTMCTEDIL